MILYIDDKLNVNQKQLKEKITGDKLWVTRPSDNCSYLEAAVNF